MTDQQLQAIKAFVGTYVPNGVSDYAQIAAELSRILGRVPANQDVWDVLSLAKRKAKPAALGLKALLG